MFGQTGSDAAGNYADRRAVARMVSLGAALAEPKFKDEPEVLAAVHYSIGFLLTASWANGPTPEPILSVPFLVQEKMLGPHHYDTLRTLRELASVCLSQGQREETKQLCQRILAGTAAIRAPAEAGADAKDIRALRLWAERKLVQVYLQEQQYTEAEPLVEEIRRCRQGRRVAWRRCGDRMGRRGRFGPRARPTG